MEANDPESSKGQGGHEAETTSNRSGNRGKQEQRLNDLVSLLDYDC